MTIIVWRDGIIAADSQTTNGVLAGKTKKLFKLKNAAIGFAGLLTDGLKLIEFLKSDEDKPPELSEDFESLMMDLRTGKCAYYDRTLIAVKIMDKFEAIGTGSELAIGAMEHGATAIEAVRVAIKRDINSGGRVVVIRMK